MTWCLIEQAFYRSGILVPDGKRMCCDMIHYSPIRQGEALGQPKVNRFTRTGGVQNEFKKGGHPLWMTPCKERWLIKQPSYVVLINKEVNLKTYSLYKIYIIFWCFSVLTCLSRTYSHTTELVWVQMCTSRLPFCAIDFRQVIQV